LKQSFLADLVQVMLLVGEGSSGGFGWFGH
jgi:hypothetical protein